jgi:hypothetical protein
MSPWTLAAILIAAAAALFWILTADNDDDTNDDVGADPTLGPKVGVLVRPPPPSTDDNP